jgi:hypothetical protein
VCVCVCDCEVMSYFCIHNPDHTSIPTPTQSVTPGGGVTPYIRVYGYVPRMWVGFFAFFVFGWVGFIAFFVFGWVDFL